MLQYVYDGEYGSPGALSENAFGLPVYGNHRSATDIDSEVYTIADKLRIVAA